MQRHEVNKCCWKNGADRLARLKVATNHQFVKNSISPRRNKMKCNKMRYACIPFTTNQGNSSLRSYNTGF